MATIPANYPDGCTPEQIRTAIRDMQNDLVANGYQINSVLQYSPLINLGQSELERRQNEAIVKQSKAIGFISLGIAIIALVISVHGEIGNSEWEKQQLTLLETISKNGDVSQALRQQSSILEKVSTQLNTGIICVLKGDTLKVDSEKPKSPKK